MIPWISSHATLITSLCSSRHKSKGPSDRVRLRLRVQLCWREECGRLVHRPRRRWRGGGRRRQSAGGDQHDQRLPVPGQGPLSGTAQTGYSDMVEEYEYRVGQLFCIKILLCFNIASCSNLLGRYSISLPMLVQTLCDIRHHTM